MSYYKPPDYIDNTADERKLVTVLSNLIIEAHQRELDIASGFFEPRVWEMLAKPLQELTAFRLLLGLSSHGLLDTTDSRPRGSTFQRLPIGVWRL